MKKLLALLALFLIGSFIVQAQDYDDDDYYDDVDDYETVKNYPMGVGIHVAYGGGWSLREEQPGTTNIMSYNGMPDIGVVAYMPLGEEKIFGALGELSYYSTSFGTDVREVLLTYIIMGASVYYKGMYAGLNYGFTMGAETGSNGNYSETATENYKGLMELKAGYEFVISKSTKNRITLFAQATYSIVGLLVTDIKYTNEGIKGCEYGQRCRSYNYQPFQIKLGFNYMFNMINGY